MATGTDLRRMALALKGTTEGPHFDRAAFKVARIYVTLAARFRGLMVMYLRMAALAGGGAPAILEAQRMLAEKTAAMLEAPLQLG
jgi:hypothetical protein